MRSNTLAAGVGGFVVALAVAGIGLLLVKGGKTPDQPPPPKAAPPAPSRDEPRTPALTLPERASEAIGRPAPRNKLPIVTTSPEGMTREQMAARVYELLGAYDLLMSTPIDAAAGMTLAERRRRMDEIVAELAALGPDGVPVLLEQIRRDALRNETSRQTVVVQALAAIAGPAATKALSEVLATEALGWGVQMAAVVQLGKRGEEGLKALRERFALAANYQIRGAILKQLGNTRNGPTPEDMALIAQAARSDPNENVRRAAIRQLSLSQDPASVRLLEDLARSGDDVNIRQVAIQGYAQARQGAAVPILQDIVFSDPNLRVRSVAILGLQVVGDDAALAVLNRIAQDATQPADIQARARGAVAAIERERAGGASVGDNIRTELKPIQGRGLRPIQPAGGR